MSPAKPKSLQAIEDRLQGLEEGSLRHSTLQAAREFKISWIRLGQMLHQVWREKSYKEWGYVTFEGYVAKEIGIRHQTASKVVKSYLFLEREEPHYVRAEALSEEARTLENSNELPNVNIPGYEAVNQLRLAKGKISEDEYKDLRDQVFEEGKEGKEVKEKLQLMMREKEPADPAKERAVRRQLSLGRLVRTMKSVSEEAEHAKFLPKELVKQLRDLVDKIESELERH